MDNTEYTIKRDEIRELIAQKEYVQAAEIADTIDWRRVRSVMMLCTVSDLYKINRRYEDAKDMLLLAYELRPGGRGICYSLCELCIKLDDFVEAVGYYKEFVQASPKNPDRYVLQYKLYEAQDVSLEERIEVLKELKHREYREKWLYELAYLYHRIGQATLCVEECDELILWFGDGKYVYKAMELKKLHQPLTPAQQKKYDHRFDDVQEAENAAGPSQKVVYPQPAEKTKVQERDRQSAYKQPQGYDGQPVYERPQGYDEQPGYEQAQRVRTAQPDGVSKGAIDIYERNMVSAEAAQSNDEKAGIPDIQVPIMDMGQYNTMNLQAELKAGLEEVLGREEDAETDAITKSIIAPMFEADAEVLDLPDEEELNKEEPGTGEVAETEIFFSETGELNSVLQHAPAREIVPDISSGEMREIAPDIGGDTKVFEIGRARRADTKSLTGATATGAAGEINAGRPVSETEKEINAGGPKPAAEGTDSRPDVKAVADETAQLVMNQMRMENKEETRTMVSRLPEDMARVLAQESDGQISFVLPESEKVEKQITGQLSIQDILAEWERRKQETAEKRKEDLERRIQQQTGEMFTEFEAAVRDGLLEKLESETGASESVQEQEGLGEFGGQTEEISAVADGELSSGIETPIGSEDMPEEPALESGDMPEEPASDSEDWQEEIYAEAECGEPEAVETSEDMPEEPALESGDMPEEPALESEDMPEEIYAEAECGEPEAVETIEDMLEEPASESEDMPEEIYAEAECEEPEAVEPIGDMPEELASDSEDMPEEPASESEDMPEEIYAEAECEEPEAVEPIGDMPEEPTPESGDMPEEPAPDSEDMPEEIYAEPEGGEQINFEAVEEFQEDESPEATEKMPEAEPGEEGWSDADAWEHAGDSAEFYDEEAPDTDEYVEQEEQQQEVSGETEIRPLTDEEKELYAPFIQTRAAREQLVRAIDNISLAAYTGNIVITGEEGVNTIGLAKNMIREIQASDRNLSGKVAKISGQGLNQRDVRGTLLQLKNGALIVQKASGMTLETAAEMYRTLQQDNLGLVVALEDTRKGIAKLFDMYSPLKDCFTARMDVEALSNDTLAAFGRRYAREMEYSIDELGMLALHRRIEEMQTVDHAVTVVEVKQIVDKAIRHARRKNLTHFMDVLFARRYDEEDMIILTEKDFMA